MYCDWLKIGTYVVCPTNCYYPTTFLYQIYYISTNWRSISIYVFVCMSPPLIIGVRSILRIYYPPKIILHPILLLLI